MVSSSFDAFSKVDELVSKPVLGSDGAASWQSFRNEHRTNDHRSSAAPKAPLKKADKLGTGFSSWEEERAHEGKIREAAGHAKANSGYSVFRSKPDDAAAASRKRKAQVEARIRPDDKEYFIPSKTFQGWKFDYVFTTRNGPNSTGYYWDGMDSIKAENGELKGVVKSDETSSSQTAKKASVDNGAGTKSKKKRKRKKGPVGPTFITDPNNPMEQMQAILQQRNQTLTGNAIDHNLPSGWEAAKDPSSGNTYYFHRKSGKRSWEKPSVSLEDTKDGEDRSEKLPEGWKSAVDPSSGKTYYHHTSGKTSWTKPN